MVTLWESANAEVRITKFGQFDIPLTPTPRTAVPPARAQFSRPPPPGRAGKREAFDGFAGGPLVPVEAVHQVAGDAVFLQHHGDGLRRVEGGIPLAAALGVGDERLLELIGEAEACPSL